MIILKNISKSYRNYNILDNISLEINNGDIVGIMGRSGCGKSTLLNIIGLLDFPDEGKYYLNNKSTENATNKEITLLRRNKIGFIFQDYALIKDRNVYYNISIPLICKKIPKKEIANKVQNIANQLKITKLLNKYPYELSGGECQKVSIARALIRNPSLILADEPTGALDINSELEILNTFRELNKQGVTIIIVTHNYEVAKICSKIYTIKNKKVIEYNEKNLL